MIPVARNGVGRKAAAAVSVSRQGLPRPARLYSTPTKSTGAQASLASPLSNATYPAFMPARDSAPDNVLTEMYTDMQGFLTRRTPYTFVPTPLPSDRTSSLNDYYFTDSPTQDQVSIMDACLHNLHDVPRAKQVFDRLRKTSKGDAALDVGLYNAFLGAYMEMATTRDVDKRTHWIEDMCSLYEEMEEGRVPVAPTSTTYAVMLRLYQRFNPDTATLMSSTVDLPTPDALLRAMVDRQIPVSLVVSDRSLQSSEEADGIIKLLSGSAVSMNLSKVVGELGLAQSLGSTVPDPMGDVPEVKPVLKMKKPPKVNVTRSEDGSVTEISAAEPVETEYEVPFHLNNLRQHLAQVLLARRVLSDDTSARQKLLEESVYDVAAARLKHQADLFESLGLINGRLGHVDLRAWMWQWHQGLEARLKTEIVKLIEQAKPQTGRASKDAQALAPFIMLLKPETLSILTILELMHLQGSGGVSDGMKTTRALLAIGKAVEIEYKTEMCKKNRIAVPAATGRPGESGFFTRLGYRDLHARRVAARRYMEDAEDWTSEWTQSVRVKVGSFLVDNLMEVAKVTKTAEDKRTGKEVSEEQPAFFHSYEYLRGHRIGVIKLNSLVADRIAKDSVRDTMHPRHLPMLVKPKQWLNHNEGGYLFNKISVMRYKESIEQQTYLRRAAELGHVELVFAGLDVLGSTPWKVNRSIFDVVLRVWNSGKRMPKIPPAVFDLPEPDRPPNADVDPKARNVFLMRQKQYLSDKANNHSDRCNVNYKVEIARTFLGDVFYMPHNMDFRGRAYPIPPHLNHIGDDLSRGLLKFAEGRPLGERGLRWLKIHLANVYGFDKASFDDRAQFAEDHLADIYDSAENPLEGKQWWTNADDPWQCLATCMELHAALESPNPLEYVSDLPVHQDGTCNGLQHYAALGGDSQGAKQVNLDVTDRPADVYTYVADMVRAQMAKDIEAGNEYAKKLDGKITRKVVKQTVMTTVYGVTFIGAREQIEKQLKDRGDILAEDCWFAASYLAKNVLSCIGNLFSGAKSIQLWLNTCARLISKSIPTERIPEAFASDGAKSTRLSKEQMTSVVWTTPMGLPIVQPYRQAKRKQVHTSLQTVFISDPATPAAVNTIKQASAFPPNFIHSLDATHMMLTALECRTRNITFASVHDSYWTHACSVDEMSGIIRDTFVALHSRDVLSNLAQEFKERYRNYKIPLSSLKTISSPDVHKRAEEIFNTAQDSKDLALQKTFQEVAQSVATEEEERDEEHEEEQEEQTEVQLRKRKGRPRKKPLPDNIEGGGRSVWFSVSDLIPPLPEKGKFDVNKIKQSLYFFS